MPADFDIHWVEGGVDNVDFALVDCGRTGEEGVDISLEPCTVSSVTKMLALDCIPGNVNVGFSSIWMEGCPASIPLRCIAVVALTLEERDDIGNIRICHSRGV